MRAKHLTVAALTATLALAAAGCTQKMGMEGHIRPFTLADRQEVPGTVARGRYQPDEAYSQGMRNAQLVREIPVPVTKAMLERGRQRFNIYCAPCHGQTGDGNGVIVQRGFLAPPSYHIERLRDAPAGHFFNVITHGKGAMYSYADRVDVADRWAITAYIRALQLSQNAKVADLPEQDRKKLEELNE